MFGKEKTVTDLRPNDQKTSPRKSAKQKMGRKAWKTLETAKSKISLP